MKKFFLTALFIVSALSLSAQEFDDFDSLFDNAEDLEVTVETKKEDSSGSGTSSANPYYGLKFSGHLESAIGYGMGWDFSEGKGFYQSGYLSFENHFYGSAKPSDALYVFSDVIVSLKNQNPALTLNQIYVDYNLWNKAFFTVGKKTMTWGQCRLFDSNTVLGTTESSTIMGSVNVPFGKANATFVAMYGGIIDINTGAKIDTNSSTGKVTKSDLHYAGQIEGILFDTLMAFNVHQYHPDKTTYSTLAGIDLKRTIFGFDSYVHSDTALKISSDMNKDSWSYVRTIAGFYRKFDKPNFGFNIECRHIYRFRDNSNSFEIGEQFGWNGFCNNRIALVLEGYHNLTAGTGYVTPGFVLKNVFPNATLNTGLTVNYTPSSASLLLGTKLELKVDY